MDAFDFDSLKSEKASAILQFNNFKSITKLFRIVELCLGIFFLLWTFTRLPFAVKISGEYFRLLVAIITSPLFIFFFCNLIVLTLFLKAGHMLSGQSSSANNSETESDPYEELIQTSENFTNLTNAICSHAPEQTEIEYQDKQTIFEVSSTTVKIGNSDTAFELKAFRRSQSENLNFKTECVEEEEENQGKLRRSETEKTREVANPGEVPGETEYIFDELSNEEFQRTIDAFIAKQIKFHQEEKLAIVLHTHT